MTAPKIGRAVLTSLRGSPMKGIASGIILTVIVGACVRVPGAQWSEAGRQCEALGKRLPTEARWALAARGPGGGAYPWDGAGAPGKANGRGAEDGFMALAPSGSFPGGGSPYGAQDMAGNAWEWTAGAAEGEFHILRGGSWFNTPAYLGSAARRRGRADDSDNHINGFRCACDAANAKK